MGRENDKDSKANTVKDTKAMSPGSRFVRRLIPTVAAASLSFTGCIPSGGGNNGGSDAGGGIDIGGDDTGGTDSGGTGTPIANVNGDGMVSSFEIRQFCQGWSDCDTAYFQESYGTVENCVQDLEAYLDDSRQYWEAYGAECVAAMEEMAECTLGATTCNNGEITQGYYECYDEDVYYEYCYY